MLAFAVMSVVASLVLVGAALRFRGRFYATFGGVLCAIQTVIGLAVYPSFAPVAPLVFYFQATVFLHLMTLIWAGPRPAAWRFLVTLPAHFWSGGTILALIWAPFALLVHPWLAFPPYALALAGMLQGLFGRETVVDVTLDGRAVDGDPRRYPRGKARSERPLRLVQITDPHLGPWMSVRRLRRICERAVARDPDLVLLTGDFLTMESQKDPELLAHALEPLAALPGRVFACRGNHDLEAPETVAEGLRRAGARLLIDESEVVETAAGPVQILGIDFRWRGRKAQIADVVRAHERIEGAFRLVLLHDPGAFKHVPDGEADLVLSGHTHGGQVGLVSLGLSWTAVSRFMPDHGFWARGKNRLYVHRGTGHYGFPLRLGVPAEQSLLQVHRVADA